MDPEIDITQDLTDGRDGALGEGAAVQPHAADGAQLNVPDGAVPVGRDPEPKVVEQPADNKPSSLRDQLSNAFKEPEAPAAPTKPQQQQNVSALTVDNDGKYRHADGLFASEADIAAFKAAQAPEPNNQQQQQNEAQQQAPAFLQYMTPIEQQQYTSLPEELRTFFGRTMEGVGQQAARYNEYEVLERELIGPRRQAWASQGMNPAVAINQLFALSDFASKDPKGFVMYFAEQNKIDLDEALDERERQNSLDPQVRQLQQQYNALQQHVQGQQQQQQQAALEESQKQVNSFANEVDGAGKPKRPYLARVVTTWTNNIQALRQANPMRPTPELLQEAYEAACWADPVVRAEMQKESEAARTAEARARADAAKHAGSSITGGPQGAAPVNGRDSNAKLSVRQSLEQAMAEAST
jgi:hypothetical protein